MQIKPEIETFAKIKVIGVGGSGGSAINRMITTKIRGVEFLVANTDIQALHISQASTKLHIGKTITKGLGAGMNPDMGRRAAEESQNEIRDALAGADMVFITCGLGGGTGTGAAPVVAELARDVGALTIAVVTKPFSFEGTQRKKIAEEGWNELSERVDAIITIANDKILQIVDKKTTFQEALFMADEILQQGVRGISELITVPGLVNVDFADVKAIMSNTGSALMGIGSGTGDNRAVEAAKTAILSPLLDFSIEGARGILFTVSGGPDLGMLEINEAAKIITSSADPEAKVIFGAIIDENLGDELRITVVATGFGERDKVMNKPAEKVIQDTRPSMYTPNQALFQPPAPRIVVPPKPFVKREEPAYIAPQNLDEAPEDEASDDEGDDELEIPAFIRKKMM